MTKEIVSTQCIVNPANSVTQDSFSPSDDKKKKTSQTLEKKKRDTDSKFQLITIARLHTSNWYKKSRNKAPMRS